jgi:radical SAM protein with 4Fe4S-binding SPASM domain
MDWNQAKAWWERQAWPRLHHRPAAAIEPGLYHYQRLQGDWPTRFHLRVDPDGGGLLLANAAEAAYLSPVGVEMAHEVLEERSDAQIVAEIERKYHSAEPGQIATDLARIRAVINDLSRPGDNYPITNLGEAGEAGRVLAAPYRADVVQGEPLVMREILRKLWDYGIPHVSFLAQPQAPASDLPLLVEAAGDLGMVAGVRAVASWLPPEVIQEAALAGLDHLDLLYVSAEAAVHDALTAAGDWETALAAFAQCLALELAPVAEVPLYAGGLPAVRRTMASLHERSVSNLTFFALACPEDDAASQAAGALPARAIPPAAVTITEAAEENGARYIWAPPVRFDPARTLAAQVQAGPRAAGDSAIRVEADGRVYPARGPRACTGSLFTEKWEAIWNHECFARYRGRLAQPKRCPQCPDLPICQADCPQDPAAWSDDTISEGGEAR